MRSGPSPLHIEIILQEQRFLNVDGLLQRSFQCLLQPLRISYTFLLHFVAIVILFSAGLIILTVWQALYEAFMFLCGLLSEICIGSYEMGAYGYAYTL